MVVHELKGADNQGSMGDDDVETSKVVTMQEWRVQLPRMDRADCFCISGWRRRNRICMYLLLVLGRSSLLFTMTLDSPARSYSPASPQRGTQVPVVPV